jgi:hypothetical protein
MNEPELPDEPQLDRWSIPLDEPDPPTLPFVPPVPTDQSDDAPDVFPFPPENDSYPSEGHHPRLFRFGEAA